MAIDAAYRDVEDAFAIFLSSIDEDMPIVLAGHSQGSVHLIRLLRDRAEADGFANRIAALYAIGWPISLAHDLPSLPFPACAQADQSGCIVSYASFADPADPIAVA